MKKKINIKKLILKAIKKTHKQYKKSFKWLGNK